MSHTEKETSRDCPSTFLLQSFLDDSISAEDGATVQDHLEGCQRCIETLDELSTDIDIRRLHDEAASDRTLSVDAVVGRIKNSVPESMDGFSEQLSSSVFENDTAQQEQVGSMLGHYHLDERIGVGSTGVLFKATDTRLQRLVAVKVLRSELTSSESYQARLVREAKVAASLNHDHIVKLFEIGQSSSGAPYLVMEYVFGQSLRELIDSGQNGSVPQQAARTVSQVAWALDAAHNKNLVHRDVKPANIMLDVLTGRAKLTDFGLTREEDFTTRITIEGAIAGTPAYMSPEQIADPDSIDGRSDVYSLGVVFYELLTGDVPYRGVVRMTLMQALHEEPKPPRLLNDSVPRDLETICLKAMAKDPRRRYQSARALAEDVERFLSDQPILARPVSQAERFMRWCRHNASLAIVSGLLLLTLMVVALGSTFAAVVLKQARDAAFDAENEARRIAESNVQLRDLALESLINREFEFEEFGDAPLDEVARMQMERLEDARRGFEAILNSAESAGIEDIGIGEAHYRLGCVYAAVGDKAEATVALRRALEILEDEQSYHPLDEHLTHLIVSTHVAIARLAMDSEDIGMASQELELAIQQAQHMHEDDPHRSVLLAYVFGLRADFSLSRSRPSEALEDYGRRAESLHHLVYLDAHYSTDPHLVFDLAKTHLDIARVHLREDVKNDLALHLAQCENLLCGGHDVNCFVANHLIDPELLDSLLDPPQFDNFIADSILESQAAPILLERGSAITQLQTWTEPERPHTYLDDVEILLALWRLRLYQAILAVSENEPEMAENAMRLSLVLASQARANESTLDDYRLGLAFVDCRKDIEMLVRNPLTMNYYQRLEELINLQEESSSD